MRVEFRVRVEMVHPMHAGPGFGIDTRDPIARDRDPTGQSRSQEDRLVGQATVIEDRNIKNVEEVSKQEQRQGHPNHDFSKHLYTQYVNARVWYDPAMPPKRSDQKLVTRRRLIESALKLSADRGFSALSLREVSKAAGITPAAFYKHFPDMEELGLALLDEVGMSLRRLLREARRRSKSGGSVVDTSVAAFLDYVHDNANLFRLLLGERQGASLAFRRALHLEMDLFVGELTEDLLRKPPRAKDKALSKPAYAAEAIVAVVFTVGAEALDLPKHKLENLALRLREEVRIILRGAR